LINTSQIPPDRLHSFKHFAMNAIFEIRIVHENFSYARSAAAAAFELLNQLENDLSRFIENSDVSLINHLKKGESAVVSLNTFECLRICQRMFEETFGAFDAGMGRLIDFWKNRSPVSAPLKRGSIKSLVLNADRFEVINAAGNISIDLGGIGKGFALDRMKELLLEWDITNGLLHGGYSSILCFGEMNFPLSVHHPFKPNTLLQIVHLQNQALGASGTEKGAHVIDPRTNKPIAERKAAWALAPTAAVADVLSTAGLIWDSDEFDRYFREHPKSGALLIVEDSDGSLRQISKGNWKQPGSEDQIG